MIEQDNNDLYFQVTLFTAMIQNSQKAFDFLRIDTRWGAYRSRSLLAVDFTNHDERWVIEADLFYFRFTYDSLYGWQGD